ncbi:methionine ABC transporter ATP-binding protein [Gammaproteobacteria bacterium 45_16_T64]|nr:methionine ABC transporter ATP-binding protein [Gammaproteobacteria bacterium 45_16_T64]
MTDIIDIQNLRFRWPGSQTDTLSIDSLQIKSGEKVFIRGASGSGKTTLLNILSGVSEASSGLVSVLGTELKQLKSSTRDRFRAQHIGYIFQAFNLIPYLSMEENVALACHFSKERKSKVLAQSISLDAEIRRLLAHLELEDEVLSRKPVTELSIGQQQRVAVARAIIGKPELIIADEPTSALDSDRRQKFIELLFREINNSGSTLVFVSHDESLESLFDRSILLSEINKNQGEIL